MSNWVRQLPLRKLLAAIGTAWALALCTASFVTGQDLGSGVTGVLQALVVTAIGGYTGSSALEAIKGKREER